MNSLEIGIILSTSLALIFALIGWRFIYVARQGKRTKLSYETKETRTNLRIWKDGNQYAGKVALTLGLAIFIFGYFFSLILIDSKIQLYIIFGTTIVAIILFFVFSNSHIKMFAKQLRHSRKI